MILFNNSQFYTYFLCDIKSDAGASHAGRSLLKAI